MPIKILVSDTNIWIDLHRANILGLVFKLPYEFVVTDFVYRELKAPGPNDLTRLGLRVETLGPDSILELMRLREELANPSLADLSCFHLASSKKWTLLTGDKAVRIACQERGVEVHGILWILDQLYEKGILDGSALSAAIQAMLDHGARLPKAECQKRLKLWTGTP